ncbi:MAG: hypothetical protein FJX54_12365 [Alphaproteobacteria bacterium]|nr:hypothetical protein [Alphaproteobacteria bacterium]
MVLRAPFTSEHSDLNAFLFAPIGADKAGMTVTVATAMARAGVDPREEAVRLAYLSPGDAAHVLATIIDSSEIADPGDTRATADRLIGLLPRAPAPTSSPAVRTGRIPSAVLWVVCLGMAALFVLSAMGDNPASLDRIPPGQDEATPRHPLP